MRFGGHETFAVREDWLSKGLFLLKDEPDAFEDPLVSDYLGVGRNMGKSIRHWMQVTGLIEKPSREKPPQLTPVGRAIFKHDPYMLEAGTWWVLHINLVTQDKDAVAWSWFFNRFARDRFDRRECVEQLQRFIALEGKKSPSPKTLTRDVSCLLTSYALPIPPDRADPEDGQESPFRNLGLLTHYKESGTYTVNRRLKDIPPELVGYAFVRTWGTEGQQSDDLDVNFSEALARLGGPGRVFALTAEGLMELLDTVQAALGEREIHTRLMGGERMIQVHGRSPAKWLELYYRRTRHT